MARLELILQAATSETHARSIRALLNRLNPKAVLISVAFVREAGVEAVEAALKAVASKTRLFIGIRNGITTVQAAKRLLKLKAQLFAVDTGSRDTIFHPKLYMIRNDKAAGLIVGSANLTFQGLHNNIEVSTLVTLDLKVQDDRNFVESTLAAFDQLLKNHPQHVFPIKDDKHAEELFQAGRLADETVIPAPTSTSGVRKGTRDTLPRMKLNRVWRPRIRVAVKRAATKKVTVAAAIPIPAVRATEYYLVWESKGLTERDLNVPAGVTTHRTGSMLWKKGAMENIDQRHFFRDEIFDSLVWRSDPKKPHLERAEAKFELVIKNLNYGQFKLRLAHNTRTNTRSYRQRNAMTQLHWGDALPLVARRDLLGRTMYLYRKDANPPEFLIEID